MPKQAKYITRRRRHEMRRRGGPGPGWPKSGFRGLQGDLTFENQYAGSSNFPPVTNRGSLKTL